MTRVEQSLKCNLDKIMFVTHYVRLISDFIKVTDLRSWGQNPNVGDSYSLRISHQHLNLIIYIDCLKFPLPSLTNKTKSAHSSY